MTDHSALHDGAHRRDSHLSLRELTNPWRGIGVVEYDAHMSHSAVRQHRALNSMFRSQYEEHLPEKLLCIGVGTGNGLEHVRPETTRALYAIDVNERFLDACRCRYAGLAGALRTRLIDLNHGYFTEEPVDLVIANLVLEFIEIERFIAQAELVSRIGTVVSVIFQVVRDAPFISGSGIVAIGDLSGFKQEIDQADLEQRMTSEGFSVVTERRHLLHDGKELVRLDFRKR